MTARSFFAADRYSAKKMAKPVNFVCVAPDARHVHLMGDFNDWDPGSHPMKRQPDGAWLIQVPLNHGDHHTKFSSAKNQPFVPQQSGSPGNRFAEKVWCRLAFDVGINWTSKAFYFNVRSRLLTS